MRDLEIDLNQQDGFKNGLVRKERTQMLNRSNKIGLKMNGNKMTVRMVWREERRREERREVGVFVWKKKKAASSRDSDGSGRQ